MRFPEKLHRKPNSRYLKALVLVFYQMDEESVDYSFSYPFWLTRGCPSFSDNPFALNKTKAILPCNSCHINGPPTPEFQP